MVRTGVNFISMDKLSPFDGRLEAAVWSWDIDEPDQSGENDHCAVQKANGRFDDTDCNTVLPFACRKGYGEWYITAAKGVWNEGESVCAEETDGDCCFAVPVSGYDNERLIETRTLAGKDTVWLNYENEDGTWKRDFEESTEEGCGTAAYAGTGKGSTSPLAGILHLMIMMAIPLMGITLRRRFRGR
jgi:hypothetical protein